jgi:hypothetical protein
MRRESLWRAQARLAIDLAVEMARRDGVTDTEELVRAANAAYPFGPRLDHPYQVWLDEVRQLRERFRLEALEADMRRVADQMRAQP